MYLRSPLFLPAILGALSWLAIYRNRANRDRNGPLVLALALAAGLVLSIISKHPSLYNLQALTIPVAVGFSRLVVVLWLRTKGLGYRLIVVAALLGYPTAQVGMSLTSLISNGIQISQNNLQRMMDLARPGGRSCLAFAPYHPVFCHDVSELALQFDLHFARVMTDPQQIERFRRIWREGMQKTLEHPPDIIVRGHPARMWQGAVKHGLVSPEDLAALDRLKPGYTVQRIGRARVWVRP
jgi:hypothetical protein